ncbi:pyridine nucleotide-disulfide oxidoreductase [Streptomyces sp. NPDC020917]|uniref:pyridine nucleotide-disulfide oxidoreductase n=1 Tax=Streptomyces sp. NPDC020917 TaxID=3365102 RepID=UPI00378C40D8
MAASEARDVPTELIIVGGGPAGCAAALMAASVGMRSVLVEADALCAKLQHIGAINNVVGGHSSGPELAAAIAKDLARTELCEIQLGVRAVQVQAYDDHVAVLLDGGSRLVAPYAVVATGVGPLGSGDVPWLTVPDGLLLPTLWGAKVPDDHHGPLLVIGADRPLGTFLRVHPALDLPVLVAYPPEDEYKVDEVRHDPRVTLNPIASLSVRAGANAQISAEWTDREGRQSTQSLAAAYLNLGSAPVPPAGAIVTDATGYCPPDHQHPRIMTAGDLRSSRFQRIMTAIGSGTEAALRAYYDLRGVPSP